MDKVNGKTKFNLIDVLVIITVLVIVAAVIFFVITRGMTNANVKKYSISYTVKITPVSEDNLKLIRVGDTVLDSATAQTLGKIISIKTEKVINITGAYETDEAGNKVAVAGEYENLYVLFVTISGECVVDEHDIASVAGNRILVGAPLYFADGNYASTVYCTDFTIEGGR
ncbi:MAG: DUF4330 domain-containing protein [Clostridiales bacterium]|nr:DUF4330 domain-containing protein [Clostridiales bacterium]